MDFNVILYTALT